MSAYDKLFLAGYFLAIILIQCIWQRALIKADKHIYHFWHGMVYVITICPILWLFWPIWWQVIVIAVAERLALFDPVLNWVRGKRPLLTYNGKGTTGSVLDKAENTLSTAWLTVLKLAYIVVFIIVIIKIK